MSGYSSPGSVALEPVNNFGVEVALIECDDERYRSDGEFAAGRPVGLQFIGHRCSLRMSDDFPVRIVASDTRAAPRVGVFSAHRRYWQPNFFPLRVLRRTLRKETSQRRTIFPPDRRDRNRFSHAAERVSRAMRRSSLTIRLTTTRNQS
jgi:hypothetical protein